MSQIPTIYFEKLLESSPDIVVAVDVKGKIIFYNDGARKTLGYLPSEILGQHVTLLYPCLEEARKVMATMRSGDHEEKGKVKNFETFFVAKEGEKIPVAVSGCIINGEQGEERGSIGFAKDLREIRRQGQLATLGEIAVGLAHQVNNPLEVILNNLNLVKKYIGQVASDEEYLVESERLESVQQELAKIQSIINRMGEMAKDGEYGTREYLPGTLMTDLQAEKTEEAAASQVHAVPQGSLAGLTLLVVDDDLGVCHSLRDLLRCEGCTVEMATGGQRALEILSEKKIDLVLSDVVMPDMDGYDLYMALKERYRAMPVILMTAYYYDKDHVIQRSRLQGIEGVIFKKPIDPGRLKDIILTSCRRQHPPLLAKKAHEG